jgi:uncharacterized protein YxjI
MAGTVMAIGTRAAAEISAAIFQQDSFVVRRKIFSFAPRLYIRDLNGSALAFVRQKFFTVRDDIRIFTDETQSFELLRIKGRNIIEFGAAFDVTDSLNGQKVGVLKRRGWKSLLRSEWHILDSLDQEIGKIREDSAFLAAIRRLVLRILPQSFTFEVDGQVVGTAIQNWNIFAPTMTVDFTSDPGRRLDRRLLLAAIILLMTVEKNQENAAAVNVQ